MTDKKSKKQPKKETLKQKAKRELEAKQEKVKENKGVSSLDYLRTIATKAVIEKDFLDNYMMVTFETAPGVERTIKTKKPTHNEMIEMIKFAIELSAIQNSTDISKTNILGIYDRFAPMAADACIDKSFDVEFWNNAPDTVLQNFVNAYITKSQGGTSIPDSELKSFRTK